MPAVYTPNTFISSDFDMFFTLYTPEMVGKRPVLESIDEGKVICIKYNDAAHITLNVVL